MIGLMVPDLSVFVLAGGASSRMGRDKAFLRLNGRTLLQTALDRAASLSPRIFIVGQKEKFGAFGTVIEDRFAGRGPLAGIEAALAAGSTDLNLMLAVDLPFLTSPFLHYLAECAAASAALVTVPRTDKGYQPLCAVYRLDFGPLAQIALEQGQNKIDSLFASVPTLAIEEEDLLSQGFSAALFDNLNTAEDLAKAETRSRKRE
jgi:molybdopterin-guanine dinucleotide biosynthesis protein A